MIAGIDLKGVREQLMASSNSRKCMKYYMNLNTFKCFPGRDYPLGHAIDDIKFITFHKEAPSQQL